ncbi:MAG TPA: glycogen/starch/alpha-glucan phosphorylase [Herpetosiphonaceae bacterium]
MTTTVDTLPDLTVERFQRDFLDHLRAVRGVDLDAASRVDCYHALAHTLRRSMLPRALDTRRTQVHAHAKWVYYLSAEYLLGRQLANNLLSADLTAIARQALTALGLSLDELGDVEIEPGLGNGGLGRLAACFLDAAAALKLPMVGYGIRYEYGIFRQTLVDGWQVERPDEWMLLGNPWELPHPELAVTVGFGGHTEAFTDAYGRYRVRWRPARTVLGIPYYYLVPGYRSGTINSLRLWSAQATEAFNLDIFNRGDYTRAVQDKTQSETISKVLYPVDETPQGRQLRLEQQYFFVACSLRDILRRLPDEVDLDRLPEQAVIQLNDTHPTVAIPEMMRLLVDEYLLPWERAWAITQQLFAYTCHTLLPEALETWPVSLFEQLLPRHLEIIYEINRRFLDTVRRHDPGDEDRVRRMSLIEEQPERRVRMAHLAAVGSFKINGVAALHSTLLRDRVLTDFADLWPDKFTNVTNGVTPRRFVHLANPALSDLITATIGGAWLTDLDQLKRLEPSAEDAGFRARWREIKQHNKQALATLIAESTGVGVRPDAMFDIMAKRLHEYKRQLLKLLHVITLYNRIKADPHEDRVPRVVCFAAKAAPGYRMAKLIIKLINDVARVVNADPDVGDRLKVVFLPNFNVTLAERIYPAADLSEQISLAGKEASGTGNMKFALNGALTIGTLDGANVEIRDLVGADNFFLFGLTEDQATATRGGGYTPRAYAARNPMLTQALDQIAAGVFSPQAPDLFQPIVQQLLDRDEFLLLADYASYVERQDEVDQAYRDVERWTRMAILNTARCGYFSSDRSVREYATRIWQVVPVDVAAGERSGASHRRDDARRAAQAAGANLTDAEWELLSRAPVVISRVMVAAVNSSVIGTVQEEGAMVQVPGAIRRRYGANPLIRAVLAEMKVRRGPRLAPSRTQDGAPTRQRTPSIAEAQALCIQIAEILAQKTPEAQAAEFKEWLLETAATVANAASEGGMMAHADTTSSDGTTPLRQALREALRVVA